MLPGVPYEFYASQSGVEPKYLYTITQHQLQLFTNSVGYQDGYDYDDYAKAFFESNSGLTPKENYSEYQHALAYFNSVSVPAQWVQELIINLGANTLMSVTLQDTLDSLNDTAFSTFDALDFQAVYIQITDTFTGTIRFEVSNDGINWVTKNLVSAGGASATQSTAVGIWSGDIGARYFRVIMSAYTTGTATVTVAFSAQSQANNLASQTISGAVTIGAAATSIGKAEDAVHASGDVGVPSLGVRQPATPAIPTSAAGDYSYVLVDSEGKQLPSGQGAPETAFQSYTNLTAVTNVALRAAGAAGIRNYLKDIVLDNTGAAAARVIIQDGTTTIFSATVPASSTLTHTFTQPVRGTAATALNAQLGAAGTVSVTASGFLGV